MTQKGIGIYSGTFDPVHAGHVTVALNALKSADLEEVYFAPEAQPRRKSGFTHYGHRLALLRLATAPHDKLKVLELPDKRFSVEKTVPRLKQLFHEARLVYICGSDMVMHMPSWKLINALFLHMDIVVVMRHDHSPSAVNDIIKSLTSRPGAVTILPALRKTYSATAIRQALASGEEPDGLLRSTKHYIAKNWLYSFPGPPTLS